MNEDGGEDPSTFRIYDSVTIQAHLPVLNTMQNHGTFSNWLFFFSFKGGNLLPHVNEKPGI